MTGEAPLIDTIERVGGHDDRHRPLETLPTAGRNAFLFAVTVPNVIPSGDPQFVRQQDQTNSSLLSLAGGPRRGNNYTLEGVSITDLRNRAVIIPNIEAVEEVKVQVSTFDAEMGRTGGGVFNTVGKSGSNNWHGSGLYQNRPSGTLGKFFFARQRRVCDKPESYYHLWGGSFGGPIVRNKTFFWASTEGYQTLTGRNTVLTLPTERERNGDFSQSGVTIYDPLTYDPVTGNRQPFPGNVIPANRISQVARNSLPVSAAALIREIPAGGRGAHRQGEPVHAEDGSALEREADDHRDVRVVRLRQSRKRGSTAARSARILPTQATARSSAPFTRSRSTTSGCRTTRRYGRSATATTRSSTTASPPSSIRPPWAFRRAISTRSRRTISFRSSPTSTCKAMGVTARSSATARSCRLRGTRTTPTSASRSSSAGTR